MRKLFVVIVAMLFGIVSFTVAGANAGETTPSPAPMAAAKRVSSENANVLVYVSNTSKLNVEVYDPDHPDSQYGWRRCPSCVTVDQSGSKVVLTLSDSQTFDGGSFNYTDKTDYTGYGISGPIKALKPMPKSVAVKAKAVGLDKTLKKYYIFWALVDSDFPNPSAKG